ncbi:hypothetical protein LshimejAT787_1201590 [Lyophyllum shimeji]|uniref:Uncharacterized protein n=1 Tax=Lyophyllum shimeji TaxID=47721 RepID=A0A9P3PVC9_LYOSH|nr:hypothetical protein LshimejAT787_1201590 [Lyophyllum shimeji]
MSSNQLLPRPLGGEPIHASSGHSLGTISPELGFHLIPDLSTDYSGLKNTRVTQNNEQSQGPVVFLRFFLFRQVKTPPPSMTEIGRRRRCAMFSATNQMVRHRNSSDSTLRLSGNLHLDLEIEILARRMSTLDGEETRYL